MQHGDHENAHCDRSAERVESREQRASRKPSSRTLESAARWPRAEGYARQRTDLGHEHESVFGDLEGAQEDWEGKREES